MHQSSVAQISGQRPAVLPRKKARRLTHTERLRIDLTAALAERDPEFAEVLSNAFCARYMGPWLRHGEDIAASLRAPRYATLNALHATELFWQWYGEEVCEESFPLSADHVLPHFSELSKSDLQDAWRARQCADALGMTYDVYVRGVMEAFAAAGRISRPSIKEMSGSFALLTATQNATSQLELDEFLSRLHSSDSLGAQPTTLSTPSATTVQSGS